MMKCKSCHKSLVSEDMFTKFECPKCMEETIYRCRECRRKNNLYKCGKCGFEGP